MSTASGKPAADRAPTAPFDTNENATANQINTSLSESSAKDTLSDFSTGPVSDTVAGAGRRQSADILPTEAARKMQIHVSHQYAEAGERPRITQVEFLRENVVCRNKSALLRKIAEAHADGGAQNLFFVADFDHTLSMPACLTSWSIIDSSPYVSHQFRHDAASLVTKYYPTELDSTLTPQQKSPVLTEWFHKFHRLIVDSAIAPETRERIFRDAFSYPRADQELANKLPKFVTIQEQPHLASSTTTPKHVSDPEEARKDESAPSLIPLSPNSAQPCAADKVHPHRHEVTKFRLVTAASPLAPQIPSLTIAVHPGAKARTGASPDDPRPLLREGDVKANGLTAPESADTTNTEQDAARARMEYFKSLDTYSNSNSSTGTPPQMESEDESSTDQPAGEHKSPHEAKTVEVASCGKMVLPTYPKSTSAMELRHGFDELFATLFYYKIPVAVVSAGLGNFIQACLAHNGVSQVFPLVLQRASVEQIAKLPDDVVFLAANMLETQLSRTKRQELASTDELNVQEVVADDYNQGDWVGYAPHDPIHVYRKCATLDLAKLQLALIQRQRSRPTHPARNVPQEFYQELKAIVAGKAPAGSTFGEISARPKRSQGQTIIIAGDSLGDLTIPGSLPFSARVISVGFFNTPLFYPVSYFTDPQPPEFLTHASSCPRSIKHKHQTAAAGQQAEAASEPVATPVQVVAHSDSSHCEACTIMRLRGRFLSYVEQYDVVIIGERSLDFVTDIVRSISEGIDEDLAQERIEF